jgi:hypothetical protein
MLGAFSRAALWLTQAALISLYVLLRVERRLASGQRRVVGRCPAGAGCHGDQRRPQAKE